MITVDAQELAVALRLLSKVMPTQSAIPALTHVRMEAASGRLHLFATDLELGGFADVEADVTTPMAMCLPAAAVTKLAKLKSGSVQLSKEGDRGVMVAGRIRRSYPVMDPADYPAAPTHENFAWQAETDYPSFSVMETLTSFCTSSESVMYALTGICLDPGDGKLSFVASDGKRLSLVTRSMKLTGAKEQRNRVIVPVNFLGILKSLPKKAGRPEKILLRAVAGEPMVELVAGPYRFVSRTIEGKFPDYELVIPKDRDKQAHLQLAELQGFMAEAAPKSSDVSSAMRLRLAPDLKCAVEFRRGDPDERVSSQIACTHTGEAIAVKCNPLYVAELLKAAKACGAEELRLRLKDPATAIVIDSPQIPSFTHVLMPLAISWDDDEQIDQAIVKAA